jgi:hypothetical protein
MLPWPTRAGDHRRGRLLAGPQRREQAHATEVRERLPHDVPDDRGVLPAPAVDHKDVAGPDQVDGLEGEQDVARLRPDSHRRAAHLGAAGEPAHPRPDDPDGAPGVRELRRRELAERRDERSGRPLDFSLIVHCSGCDLDMDIALLAPQADGR